MAIVITTGQIYLEAVRANHFIKINIERKCSFLYYFLWISRKQFKQVGFNIRALYQSLLQCHTLISVSRPLHVKIKGVIFFRLAMLLKSHLILLLTCTLFHQISIFQFFKMFQKLVEHKQSVDWPLSKELSFSKLLTREEKQNTTDISNLTIRS